ncbi:MAG: indole-3-glycerol phosphate synthase TrpC [Acidimicrobiia bacterium]|nr:indole-3-glycerol phosphate synthase TrpC [Acidimicrobiia bacterium]
MSTYLDRILAAHRAMAAADRRDLDELAARAAAAPPTRGFRAGLVARPTGEMAVIAEVKRRSPSKGALAPGLDPAVLARSYASGGAACLSVLTDEEFFGGSADDLRAARTACSLPVLRKDFTVGRGDVCDARIMGADAVLLIVAALDPGELSSLASLARDLSLDVLVEVHDEAELAVALDIEADLVGVNQRDLVTFEVDTERAERMAAAIPAGVVSVAESGIGGPADVVRLADAGYDAVLVGESLVRSSDPAAAVAELRNPAVPSGADGDAAR